MLGQDHIMASPVPGYLDLPSSRMPRLTYRKKSCGADSAATSASETFTTISTGPSTPAYSDHCPSPRCPTMSARSPLSPRPSSTASSFLSSTPDKDSKKKTSFFSGLFSVKEPSAQALIDYQRQMKKQSSSKNGRVRAVGIPGVSSATLPPTVPKVNSKWDGVPQSVKEKDKRKQLRSRKSISGQSSHRRSSNSSGSDMSRTSLDPRSFYERGQSHGTLGSAHSNGSGKTLAEIYGWEVTDCSRRGSFNDQSTASSRPSTSRATSSRSAPNPAISPLLPIDDLLPPKVPTAFLERSPLSLTPSPALPDHSYSPGLTPFASSPATPDASTPHSQLTSHESEPKSCDGMKVTTIEAPFSGDEVIIKSAGINILGPPVTAKRRPKPLPLQSAEGAAPPSAPNGLNPILKNKAGVVKDTPPERPSPTLQLATCSSDKPYSSRRNSTRERLGLGAHLRSSPSSLAPWEFSGQASQGDVEVERIFTPTPESGNLSKKKSRLSLFHR